MTKYLFVLSFLILSACSVFQMGENVLFVDGDLSSSSLEGCEVHLIYESEATARDFNVRPVIGKFSEDYVVAPSEEVYTVEVICKNKLISSTTAIYPSEIKKFNLGVIGK